MMLSIVTAILLFVFGLDPATGKLHYKDITQKYKDPTHRNNGNSNGNGNGKGNGKGNRK